MNTKPVIAVSRCLLGDAVRYDGRDSKNKTVIEILAQQFELLAVCPEVEAGLAIPRSPVRLTGSIEQPKLTGRDDPAIDISRIMLAYCEQKPAQLAGISGYVFKSRSPSCGLDSTPVFVDGECITEHSRGVFARAICDLYPDLPVIEETELDDALEDFILAVYRKVSA